MALWSWDGEPRWSFVADTDMYAGNFERPMFCYVMGMNLDGHDDEEDGIVGPYLKRSRQDFAGSLDLSRLFSTRVDDPGDDGIHRTPVSLAPTPGLSNDGHGRVRELRPGQVPKYAAFHSVAIHLRLRPSQPELDELKRRVLMYSELPQLDDERFRTRPRILACRLVEERTVLAETAV